MQRSVSSTTIAKLAIASTLAIGTAAIATPARAVYFYDSSITFTSSDLNNFYSSVAPVLTAPPGSTPGNPVSLNIPSTASFSGLTNAFSGGVFSGSTTVTPTSASLTYLYQAAPFFNSTTNTTDTPVGYLLPSSLVFTFSNNISLTLSPALFTGQVNTGAVALTNITAGGSYFTDLSNGNRTDLETLSMTVNSNNGAPNGGYSIIATTKQAPEPLTVIGTLLGGAAAIGIRKKLKSASTNRQLPRQAAI